MGNRGKKCVSVLMDKHYLGEDSYIFTCDRAVLGEIDSKTDILRDNYGNKYYSIMSDFVLKSELPCGYFQPCGISEIKDMVGKDLSLKEAISLYESRIKKSVFYVFRNMENEPRCMAIDLDRLSSMYNLGEETLKKIKSGELSIEPEEEEDDFEEVGNKDIENLIMDVINEKYSIPELKMIKKDLEDSQDDIESAIDTIDLQIEAMENNQDFVTFSEMKEKRELEEERKEMAKEEEKEKEEREKEENLEERIDVEEVYKNVVKTLIAQDEPARRVIIELARKELDARKKKEGILLTGPTGVGKTELMRLISKYINRPFLKVDSTQLTVPGYVGKDIEEVLWDLYVKCDRNVELAEKAIIYFDEIDKKGSAKKSNVNGQGVLNVLLPFIEGSVYDAASDTKHSTNRVKIDTSNMTVILGGAFTDVYRSLLEKNSIGFNCDTYDKPTYRKATTKDFVEKGEMTDEFMGRVTVIKLNDLDYEDIKRVMLESNESAMKIQEEIFKKLGVKITFTDGYVSEVAKNAIDKKTGARGLNGIIDESTWVAFDTVYNSNGEYSEVVLTEDTVKDPTSFQLVKKK